MPAIVEHGFLTEGERVQDCVRSRRKAWLLLLSVSYLCRAPGRVSERTQSRGPHCGSVYSIACPGSLRVESRLRPPMQRFQVPEGRGKKVSQVMYCPLLPALPRARAWPCQPGEHLLHELAAAGLVRLPCLCQVAGRVHHPVLQGPAGATHTPVPVLDTAEPPERYWGPEGRVSVVSS